MDYNTKYVGLDVSKEKIAVAVADSGREKPRYLGMFPNTMESLRKIIKKIGNPSNLQACYEAGATGYTLYRWLLLLGVQCDVIAPTHIPTNARDKIKTDKRDAIRLAQLHRAGELTSIYIPTDEDESYRDLVRARDDAKKEEKRVKARISALLLRYDLHPKEKVGTKWKSKYMEWLEGVKFSKPLTQTVFQEELHALHVCRERVKRYEELMKEIEENSTRNSLIKALKCLRGVDTITAVSVASEIMCFSRFHNPQQLMSYLGLVPSESSSGPKQSKGQITRTGNTLVRRLLIEASWSYRYQPALKGSLKQRNEGQPKEIQAIAWKAQKRLHQKYHKLMHKGKPHPKVTAAVARELVGFIWDIARHIEMEEMEQVS